MIYLALLKVLFFALSLIIGAWTGTAAARTNPAALDRNEIKRLIVEEAQATTLPPSLALALAKVESDFQDRALSDTGARGVMQIMPRTAREEFGVTADELWNPRLNIQLGLSFLEQLIERYGGRWDLALSHYNGGSLRGQGASAKAHGFNRRYVDMVLRWQKRYAAQAAVWRGDQDERSESWMPARTIPKAGEAIEEGRTQARKEAAAERRFQRRQRLIQRDRAAYRAERRAERRAARAARDRSRLARQRHRRAHRHGWYHDHRDLDDFTPRWRHWRYERRS